MRRVCRCGTSEVRPERTRSRLPHVDVRGTLMDVAERVSGRSARHRLRAERLVVGEVHGSDALLTDHASCTSRQDRRARTAIVGPAGDADVVWVGTLGPARDGASRMRSPTGARLRTRECGHRGREVAVGRNGAYQTVLRADGGVFEVAAIGHRVVRDVRGTHRARASDRGEPSRTREVGARVHGVDVRVERTSGEPPCFPKRSRSGHSVSPSPPHT